MLGLTFVFVSIVTIGFYIVQPMLSISRTIDTALKLRDLMTKRDAILLAKALRQKDPAELPVAGNLFRLRKGTTDLYTFNDVFRQDSMRFFGDGDLSPSCIIDCGAHIGCTSIFFALRYPKCRIVSIEPDAQNFEMLSENVRGFTNVVPINAAVWDRASFRRNCQSRDQSHRLAGEGGY